MLHGAAAPWKSVLPPTAKKMARLRRRSSYLKLYAVISRFLWLASIKRKTNTPKREERTFEEESDENQIE
ncbi:hypothetical protein [Methanocella conradii]|uniref:hypothetical protein n=1 Tax=Methanocella conradii TaxID=1175444 RepID=UPI00117F754D|nr:hypothetical protein [Methanocella conradii]